MIYIGIDTGVRTGFAVWDSEKRRFVELATMMIHEAMERILIYRNIGLTAGVEIRLYIEDASLRKWYGNAGREKLQGVGSVKRDCRIWRDWAKDKGIDIECVPPRRNLTKTNADTFKRLTGWTKMTSEHSRDAAMLVFGR